MKNKLLWICLAIVFALVFASCEMDDRPSGDDDDEDSGPSIMTIQDEREAESVADAIDDTIDDIEFSSSSSSISRDTAYSDDVIQGDSGTVTISGSSGGSGTSSPDRISSSSNIDITLTFSDYRDNMYDITITGTIEYYKYSSSTQSGAYNYSSSYDKSISGSDVHIEMDASNEDYTIVDDISLNVSDYNDNQFMLEGSVTSSSGITYRF